VTEFFGFTGLPSSLVASESGGRFDAQNDVPGAGGVGHFGRGQFSRARLEDAARAGVIPAGVSPEQFLADPQMQAAVEQWHVSDIGSQIARNGLDRYVGQSINGVTVTPEGMLAVAHLGGFGGLSRFLESGGQYNPADAYGTSLMDYLGRHGAAAGGQGNALAAAAAPRAAPQPQNALSAMMGAQEPQARPERPDNALAMLDPEAFMTRTQGYQPQGFQTERYLTRGTAR